eukprot:jgi/Botrbrau1/8304/Bobra.0251s0030.1
MVRESSTVVNLVCSMSYVELVSFHESFEIIVVEASLARGVEDTSRDVTTATTWLHEHEHGRTPYLPYGSRPTRGHAMLLSRETIRYVPN